MHCLRGFLKKFSERIQTVGPRLKFILQVNCFFAGVMLGHHLRSSPNNVCFGWAVIG